MKIDVCSVKDQNKQVYQTRENSLHEGLHELSKVFFVLIATFCEGNSLAEVEENDSNDTLVCDDDAHKVFLCSHHYFF